MEWGSPQAILGTLKKTAHREGFGDVLADGMLPAAERIGRGAEDYAYHMKGLPLYAEGNTPDDLIPRKGAALGIVVSSRGDTMRARTLALEEGGIWMYDVPEETLDKYIEAAQQKAKRIAGTEKAFLAEDYEGKPELVIYSEDIIIIGDCLSACKYTGSFLNRPFNEKYQAALFSVGTGIETSEDMLFQLARKVKNLERAYCVREGMTRDTDSLSKEFMDKPVEQGDSKGSVLETSKFEEMKSKYYALRGWDVATGIPTRETLKQTGLKDVARDLGKRGKLPGKSAEGAKQKEER
jgi:aldehyde:ferredoxin oxidoreductase